MLDAERSFDSRGGAPFELAILSSAPAVLVAKAGLVLCVGAARVGFACTWRRDDGERTTGIVSARKPIRMVHRSSCMPPTSEGK